MDDVFSKEDFESMTPYQKGYAVYMFGYNGDQPNVPKDYHPQTQKEIRGYQDGEFAAILEAQDHA